VERVRLGKLLDAEKSRCIRLRRKCFAVHRKKYNCRGLGTGYPGYRYPVPGTYVQKANALYHNSRWFLYLGPGLYNGTT